MIDYILESAIFMAVSFVCYYFLFSKGKHLYFNRIYLLFTLALSLMVPFLDIESAYSYSYFEDMHYDMFGEEIVTTTNFQNPTLQDMKKSGISKIFQTTKISLIIYLAGVLLMSYRYIKNLLEIRKLVIESKRIDKGSYKIVLMDNLTGPFSFMNHIFVNKSDYENKEIDKTIWFHELTHVYQYHSLDILFIELLLVGFYFNPLVWLYRNALKFNHEFTADENVIKFYPDLKRYSYHLIQFANSRTNNLFECGFNYLSTKRRLIMLTKSKSNNVLFGNKLVLASLVVFTTASLIAFNNVQRSENLNIDNSQFTVVIDLGHGGYDLGATNSEGTVNEVDIVNAIGDKLKEIETNINFIYTRENDQFVALSERSNIANDIKADLMLSLHVSRHVNEQVSGFTVYYSEKNTAVERSIEIGNSIVNSLQFRAESVSHKIKKADFFILNNSKSPAVMIEFGFLSNKEDVKYLTSKRNQEYLATQIVEILSQFND